MREINKVIATCLLAAAIVHNAESENFSTTIEGGRGLMYMQTARTYGKATMVFGIKGLIMQKESPVIDPVSGKQMTRTDNPSLIAVPVSFGLTDEIDLNASVYGYRDTRTLVSTDDIRLGYGSPVQGIGSTRIGVKIRLPRRRESRLQIAGTFSAMLDTSEDEADGMNYRWSRMGTDIKASLHQTVDLLPYVSLNLEEGYVLSGSKLYDDQVVGGLGLQFRFRNRCAFNLEVNNRTFIGIGPQSVRQKLDHAGSFLSFNGSPAVGNTAMLKDESADFREDFLIVSPSINLRITRGIAINLGANFNLADHVDPKESYQIVAGITFNRVFTSLIDTDGDGVSDNIDKELRTPSGYPVDDRGVAIDTDMDGVPDGIDRERNTPAGAKTNAAGIGIDTDRDGVLDGIDLEPDTIQGAPVNSFGVALDDDRDGVPNLIDREEDTPVGAVVDEAGISVDTDGDSVPDGIDMEPDSPRRAIVDAVGISIDSDDDGVPDGIDEEPDTPLGVLVDKQGRGLVKHEAALLREGFIRITAIQFPPGSSVLNPESNPVLDEVGQVLIKYSAINIQVEGHTDSSGDIQINLRLSRNRALAVREYLLKRFPQITPQRLRAVGFGSDKPVDSNATFAGRRANRRVEFVVLNRDEILNR